MSAGSTTVSSTTPSPTSAPISCPENNGTIFTASTYARFEIGCGYETAGGDVGMVYVWNFEECVNKCDRTDGCVAASLSGNMSPLLSSQQSKLNADKMYQLVTSRRALEKRPTAPVSHTPNWSSRDLNVQVHRTRPTPPPTANNSPSNATSTIQAAISPPRSWTAPTALELVGSASASNAALPPINAWTSVSPVQDAISKRLPFDLRQKLRASLGRGGLMHRLLFLLLRLLQQALSRVQ